MHVEAGRHRGDISVRGHVGPQGVQIVGLLLGVVGLDFRDVVELGKTAFADEGPDLQEIQGDPVILEEPDGGGGPAGGIRPC